MRKANYVIAVLMLILSGYVFWSAGQYPVEVMTLGPAFFPELVAGMLVFFSVALLVQTVRSRKDFDEVRGARSVFWVGICAMAAYLVLMPKISFLVATPLFLFGMGMYMAGDFKGWWKKLTVSSLVTTGALYYLFAQLLNVPLP